MNFKKWTTALMLALAVSSCIQDEALNSEAAIDACTGADVQLAHINSDSKEINIYVHKGANLAKQQLLFTLPDGATIKADEHSPNDILNNYDFSNESHSRTFTVTSEAVSYTHLTLPTTSRVQRQMCIRDSYLYRKSSTCRNAGNIPFRRPAPLCRY